MQTGLDSLFPIESDRLRLSPLTPADAAALQAISDHPVILGSITFLPRPFGIAEAEVLIRARGDGRDRFVGVWSRTDGTLAGVLGVHLQGESRVEIGYWIAPDRHGAGYATEAGRALLRRLREAAPERQVVARAFADNTGSRRVLAKLGFVPAAEAGLDPDPLLFVLPASLSGASGPA